MKIEKTTYDFKKHLINVLAAGAIALSWGAVNHVNDYIHSHLSVSAAKAKTKSKKSKSTETPAVSSMTTGGPDDRPVYAQANIIMEPGPPTGPVTAAELNSPKPMKVAPLARSSPPAQKSVQQVKPQHLQFAPGKPVAKTSSELVTAVASKVGVKLADIPASSTTINIKGISITQTKIDRKFIREVEGSALKAYVPLPKSTQSGVTIGDGFDIGQMRPWEFDKLPLSPVLKAKLKPYVGLRKMNAVAYLKSHPLTISENDLNELNVISANKDLQPLIAAYNKATGKSFLDLPANAQTAIFSFAYQYGPGFMHLGHGRQLWHYFVNQDWQKASVLLRHFNDKYTSRRAQEAQLLEHVS